MGDLVKLNNQPIELTTGFLDNILLLLKEAHDKMDDLNADSDTVICNWCTGYGYDSNGQIHDDDCILVKIRKVIVT